MDFFPFVTVTLHSISNCLTIVFVCACVCRSVNKCAGACICVSACMRACVNVCVHEFACVHVKQSDTDLQSGHFDQVVGMEEELLQHIIDGRLRVDQFLKISMR